MLEVILKSAAGSEVVDAPPYLAGQWSGEGPPTTRIGPYLRRAVSRTRDATPDEVDRAVAYARASAPAVASLAPSARAGILERASAAASTHRDTLARLLALELGKPLKDGRGEIDRVASTFAVCAAEARRIGGETLPVAGWDSGIGNTAFTYRAPAGVALAITPFNAPANLLAHKLGASFAAGNTTLVKAPPQAPAGSAAVVALLLDSGLPPEAVQLLHGGGDVGRAAVRGDGGRRHQLHRQRGHRRRRGPCRRRQAAGPRTRRQRRHHRLRGRRHRQAAARNCARTGYSNSGQSCISVQRVYVHRSRYTDFLDAFTAAVDKLMVGDPLRPGHRHRLDGRRRGRGAGGALVRRSGSGRRPGPAGRQPAGCHRRADRHRRAAGRRLRRRPRGLRGSGRSPPLRRLRRRHRHVQQQPLRPAGRAVHAGHPAASSPRGASWRSAG